MSINEDNLSGAEVINFEEERDPNSAMSFYRASMRDEGLDISEDKALLISLLERIERTLGISIPNRL